MSYTWSESRRPTSLRRSDSGLRWFSAIAPLSVATRSDASDERSAEQLARIAALHTDVQVRHAVRAARRPQRLPAPDALARLHVSDAVRVEVGVAVLPADRDLIAGEPPRALRMTA